MAVFGIIAEYNPFHNGHEYQINKIKSSGDNTVVVVMSPNVVQRGDFALLSKWTRAEASLMCGADLVIELPSSFALSTAERFAYGAVKCLDSLGCIDYLCFGSESGDLDALVSIAELLENDSVNVEIKRELTDGKTYAKARSNAVSKFNENYAKILENPNDILAVEYVKALSFTGSKIKPYPILRRGAEHNSDEICENIASASYIRDNFGLDSIKKLVPEKAFETYKKAIENGEKSKGIAALESALILKLRTMKTEQIKNLFDVSEGLENRIKRATKESTSFTELCEKIKTKRYTLSRIRRILMYALLDMDKFTMSNEIDFVRVLGHNDKGLALLSKKSAKVPVITSLVKAKEISAKAQKAIELEEKINEAFSLTLENKKSVKNEFSTPVIRL